MDAPLRLLRQGVALGLAALLGAAACWVVIAPEVPGHANPQVEAAAAAPAGALFPDGASQRSTLVRPPQPASGLLRMTAWLGAAALAFAAFAVLAAALLALRRATTRLEAECQRLLATADAERRAFARELHDQVGQSLAAIGAGAAFVDRHAGRADPATLRDCARDIAEQARELTAHVRGLLARTQPEGIETCRFTQALRTLAVRWQRRALDVAVALPDDAPALAPAQALALYRVTQEALTNVWRHGHARRVAISLKCDALQAVLRIADDGIGRAADVQRRAGRGLRGIAERAALAGGSTRLLDASPGLCVEVRLPLEAAALHEGVRA